MSTQLLENRKGYLGETSLMVWLLYQVEQWVTHPMGIALTGSNPACSTKYN